MFPASYSLLLRSIDGHHDGFNENATLLVPTIAIRNERSILLEVMKKLSFRRLWNYTVLAYGCDEHPVTKTMELS